MPGVTAKTLLAGVDIRDERQRIDAPMTVAAVL